MADELADTVQGLAVYEAITKSDPAQLVRGSLFSAEAAHLTPESNGLAGLAPDWGWRGRGKRDKSGV